MTLLEEKMLKVLKEVAFEMDRGYIFQGTKASDRASTKLLERVERVISMAQKETK